MLQSSFAAMILSEVHIPLDHALLQILCSEVYRNNGLSLRSPSKAADQPMTKLDGFGDGDANR
jgi:hypothetical protein